VVVVMVMVVVVVVVVVGPGRRGKGAGRRGGRGAVRRAFPRMHNEHFIIGT